MQFSIRIEADPAGYSEGTYGYIITGDDALQSTWIDGGYGSEQQAETAAKRHVRRLREAHYA